MSKIIQPVNLKTGQKRLNRMRYFILYVKCAQYKSSFSFSDAFIVFKISLLENTSKCFNVKDNIWGCLHAEEKAYAFTSILFRNLNMIVKQFSRVHKSIRSQETEIGKAGE